SLCSLRPLCNPSSWVSLCLYLLCVLCASALSFFLLLPDRCSPPAPSLPPKILPSQRKIQFTPLRRFPLPARKKPLPRLFHPPVPIRNLPAPWTKRHAVLLHRRLLQRVMPQHFLHRASRFLPHMRLPHAPESPAESHPFPHVTLPARQSR